MADGGFGEAALGSELLAGSGDAAVTGGGLIGGSSAFGTTGLGGLGTGALDSLGAGALLPGGANLLTAEGLGSALAPSTVGNSIALGAGDVGATTTALTDAGAAAAPNAAGSAASSFTPNYSLIPNATGQGIPLPSTPDPLSGSTSLTSPPTGGFPTSPTASNVAQNVFSQGVNSVLNPSGQQNSGGLSSLMNWIQANPTTAAALGLGGYTAYNLLTGKGNNYLPTFNPVTASSMGLDSTLASGYKAARAMATGGSTGTTDASASSYTPTGWGGVVPSSGVAPADLAATSNPNSSPLTVSMLQNLANQYNVALPSNLTSSSGTGTTMLASGGIAALGGNSSFPMSQIQNSSYSVPSQMPTSAQQVRMGSLPPVQMADGGQAQAPYDPTAELESQMMMARLSGMQAAPPTASAKGGKINGNLGGYSDGGQMLQGPGDGMSDNIPASISGKQPARLADGEFVVPADVVSGLGNGSTDAGAKHLYSMMDRVRTARTGTKSQGKQINARKQMPA